MIILDSGKSTIDFLTGGGADRRGPPIDNIVKKPDIFGVHGRAWGVDMEKYRRLFPDGEPDATLGVWVVEAPWAHPIWHSYVLILIHLRPLPVLGAPHINLEGATHEFWVYAANPEAPREPFILGDSGDIPILHPMNFGAQMIQPNDAAADFVMKATIQDIVDGKLSPDTDYFNVWVSCFGSSLVRG